MSVTPEHLLMERYGDPVWWSDRTRSRCGSCNRLIRLGEPCDYCVVAAARRRQALKQAGVVGSA